MNALKKISAAFLSMAAIAAVSAQTATTIRITGSTAFRKAAIIGIENILQAGYTFGYQGTDVTKASQAVFVGTTKTTNLPVIIKASWTGSVGGVQTLAQQAPVVTSSLWLSETLNGLTAAGTPNLNSGNIYDAATTADVTMSDSFQSSTAFTGTGYNPLVDTKVGIVPFVITKGVSSDTTVSAALANVTNVTPNILKLIFTSGAPLSMLTGNSADSGIDILPVGRDEDSGTRLDAFAESGFGIFGSPLQYQPTIASGAITGVAAYPANTVNGLSYGVGHSGYSSGGTLATTLNTPVASGATDTFGAKFALIGYFGTSDAAGVNGGANNLSYNGVPYSDAAVREGKYTFWSYEHLMYRNTLAGNGKTVADALAQQILTTDAVQAGLLISSMNVSRAVEGGVISHK